MNENLTEEMLALMFRSRIRRLGRNKNPESVGMAAEPYRIPGRRFLDVSPNVTRIKVGTA